MSATPAELPRQWRVEAVPGPDGEPDAIYVVAGEYANEGAGDALILITHAVNVDGLDARARVAAQIAEHFNSLTQEVTPA